MLKNAITLLQKNWLLPAISVVGIGTLAITATVVKAQTVIKIDGSSTVYPITEAVAEDFQKTNSAKVTVGISGTGGGFKKFCAGQLDIVDASRPIRESERSTCKAAGVKFIELPIAFDALTVVVNPKNTWASNMTVAELKKMWEPAAQGQVKTWDQIRAGWPKKPIKLFGPGADSGTFDYFTEAINGEAKKIRKDFTPSEDDNVLVQGVSRDQNALGYFGFAYYQANKSRLKAVSINGVAPSENTVIKGTYQPLSRPLFIYVNAASAKKTEVKAFVEYYLKNGARLSKAVKYIPLPAKAYTSGINNLKKGKVGTVFAKGSSVGVDIHELMQLEGLE